MESEPATMRIAPYISYKTFRTFLDDVRQHGIPLRFDADALGRFSGSVRPQLLSALRFLGLANTSNEPLPLLKELKDAAEPAQWKEILNEVLSDAYKEIMPLDLKSITPTHLHQEFRNQYKAKDAVTQKQVTFFIHAAQDAGVELSSRVLTKTRNRAGGRRATPTPKKKDPAEQVAEQGKKGVESSGYTPPQPPSDMYRTPIPLGLGRLAYIELPKDWKSSELKKLVSLMQLFLGDEAVDRTSEE